MLWRCDRLALAVLVLEMPSRARSDQTTDELPVDQLR
jgi:hypothetical protein